MRALFIFVLQVVIAILVAGAIMPAVLMAIPQARSAGPVSLGAVMGLVFVGVRLLWPRSGRLGI